MPRRPLPRRGKVCIPHGRAVPPPTTTFFRAAPEPGVIAGDKDPPRYEPSLRDLPPVGPPIRGYASSSSSTFTSSSTTITIADTTTTSCSPASTPSHALRGILVGLLAYSRWIFTSDVYERR